MNPKNKLEVLNLAKNKINEILPLAGLTSLERLYISVNQINNISSLANLTKLTDLLGQL